MSEDFSPITIVQNLETGGHFTVRASTVPQAMQLLAELQARLSTPFHEVVPATEPNDIESVWSCPDHGPDRVKPSKFPGGGLFCAARMEDGNYCRWSTRPRIRQAS